MENGSVCATPTARTRTTCGIRLVQHGIRKPVHHTKCRRLGLADQVRREHQTVAARIAPAVVTGTRAAMTHTDSDCGRPGTVKRRAGVPAIAVVPKGGALIHCAPCLLSTPERPDLQYLAFMLDYLGYLVVDGLVERARILSIDRGTLFSVALEFCTQRGLVSRITTSEPTLDDTHRSVCSHARRRQIPLSFLPTDTPSLSDTIETAGVERASDDCGAIIDLYGRLVSRADFVCAEKRQEPSVIEIQTREPPSESVLLALNAFGHMATDQPGLWKHPGVLVTVRVPLDAAWDRWRSGGDAMRQALLYADRRHALFRPRSVLR